MTDICMGCTKPIGDAPAHVLGTSAGDVWIKWHHDCHAIATDCELCKSVVAAYPEHKDAALGEAIMAAEHPFAARNAELEAAALAADPTPEA